MIELTDSSANKSLDVIRLGRKAYEKVWDRQKKLVDERRMGIVPDTLILVEHDPVYTLGKNSNEIGRAHV